MIRTRLALLAAAVAVSGIAAAAVPAQTSTERQGFSLTLSSPRAGTSTGVVTFINYRDVERDGKPPAVRKVITRFPAGTKFDDTAAPQCGASDQELMAQGRDACPDGSRVGRGNITAITDPSMPKIRADLTIFNMDGGVILLAQQEGTNATIAVVRGVIEGRTLTTDNPPVPGVPDRFQPALEDVKLVIPRRSAGGKRLVTSPGTCPSSRRLTSRGTFTYEDGVSSTSEATTRCAPPRR